MKRVFLFVTVNILVIMTISITLKLVGIESYLTRTGMNFTGLLVLCAIIGFAGAFISLAMSRYSAKLLLGVQVIDPEAPGSPEERFLLDRVYNFASDAGIATMPEVGIYDSPEVNAFATGPGKDSALVAVSTGLLYEMEPEAVEGVLAHEIAHIANGDMVTMTLLQGVINTFVMFFARVAGWVVANFLSGEEDDEGGGGPSFMMYFLATIVFEIAFSLLGSIVVAYFSRVREYSADRGGAMLAGRDNMIYALESLKRTLDNIDHSHQSLATMKISGSPSRLARLLASHPDLEERIDRLRSA